MSTPLEHDHSWGGVLRALIVFVPIYWTWVGTAVQTNLQDASRPALRLRIFASALGGVFMALALPEAYGRLGLVFACAYWAGRTVLGLGLLVAALRGRRSGYRLVVNPFIVSMLLTGPVLVLGALTHGQLRPAIWGLAALIDLSAPTALRGNLRNLHFDAAHLAELFGLFVLIALGESVVAVGTATPEGELTLVEVFAIAAAFAVSFGLWWVYFHFAADAVRHAMGTARVRADITRLVLSYGHLAVIAAVILVAVGLRESIAEPSHASSAVVVAHAGSAAHTGARVPDRPGRRARRSEHRRVGAGGTHRVARATRSASDSRCPDRPNRARYSLWTPLCTGSKRCPAMNATR